MHYCQLQAGLSFTGEAMYPGSERKPFGAVLDNLKDRQDLLGKIKGCIVDSGGVPNIDPKAYTSQIVVMTMVTLAIGGDSISSQERREAVIDGLFDLPSKVKEVFKLNQEMKDLAKLLISEQSLLVFGRGYNYATALESALKVKEVALMHSEGILAGEMKHVVDNKQQSVIQ